MAQAALHQPTTYPAAGFLAPAVWVAPVTKHGEILSIRQKPDTIPSLPRALASVFSAQVELSPQQIVLPTMLTA